MSYKIDVSVISDDLGFKRLHNDWTSLLKVSSNPTIFTTWEWQYTWWSSYKTTQSKLLIIRCFCNKSLIGIAPFYTKKEQGHSSVISLQYLGTGENEDDESASEYLDIIVETGFESAVCNLVMDYFQSNDIVWDIAHFNNVLINSVTTQHLLPLAKQRKIQFITENVGVRYCIQLPNTWEEYVNTLKKRFRKNLLYHRRRLNRIGKNGGVKIMSSESIDSSFKLLVDLHSQHWQDRGKEGAFSSQRFSTFHKKLMLRLQANNMLDLRFIYVNGQCIAAYYFFSFNDTLYYYQSGINTKYKKYSPGVVGLSYMIENAIHSAYRKFDFMKGQTDSYKQEYACNITQMQSITLYNSTVNGAKVRLFELLKKTIKLLINSLTSRR